MIMTDEHWRNHLIAWRCRLGLSVEELGKQLGLPPAAMEGLESGALQPSGDLREEWAEALHSLAAQWVATKR